MQNGIHACLNIVTEGVGVGSAVLIRGIEPIAGVEIMKRRRGIENEKQLTNGPGKLSEALGINLYHDGESLFDSPQISIRPFKTINHLHIETGTRIGITKAVDLPWRFFIAE